MVPTIGLIRDVEEFIVPLSCFFLAIHFTHGFGCSKFLCLATPSVMSSIFHRQLTKSYPQADSGNGVYLVTADGRRVLDGSSGAAVSCLGHSNTEVIEAIVTQARSLAFAHTSFYTNYASEELAKLLIQQSSSAFDKVLFLSSGLYISTTSPDWPPNGRLLGSEAVESAIKLARQYHLSNKDSGRVNIIGREYSYHGNTLGALAAGHNPPRRDPFVPLLSSAFHHTLPCFYSRDGKDGETEPQYVDRLLAAFEDRFQSLGPSTVAAVIVEPIGGATLGCVPAAKD